MVTTDTRALVFITIRSGDVVVEGSDDMHVDVKGLVSSTMIQWGPLPAIVAMQQRTSRSPSCQPSSWCKSDPAFYRRVSTTDTGSMRIKG